MVHLLVALLCAMPWTALGAPRPSPREAPGQVIVRVREGADLGAGHRDVVATRRSVSARTAIAELLRRKPLPRAAGGGVIVGGRAWASIDAVPEDLLFDEAYAEMSPQARAVYRHRTVTLRPGTDVAAAVAALRADPAVEVAEPNHLHTTSFVPSDTRYAEQWAHPLTAAEAGWDIETGDPGVVIAVVDSGVDWAHEDLAANVWTDGAGHPGRDVTDIVKSAYRDAGYDFVPGEDYEDEDDDPMDRHGHGTHVAGIAAAASDNARGIAGVCQHCRIMPVRAGFAIAVDGVIHGTLESDDIARGIVWAADHGARIVNMSFGSSSPSQVIADAVAYARVVKGVTLVAAAGNAGSSFRSYPAAFPEVVAVAATTSVDTRASFSNHGPWVAVAAPGAGILSTLPAINAFGVIGGYGSLSGTSMASPYVAGLAGLLLSRFPTLDPDQIRRILGGTADPPQSDLYIGGGRVNVAAALSIAGPSAAVAEITSPAAREALLGPPVEVIGSATGTSYELEIAADGPYASVWTPIAAGTSVVDGVLGTVDPSTLQTGRTYWLRLTVHDAFDVVVLHPIFAGWRQSITGTISPAMVADLDGDGSREIVLTVHDTTGSGDAGLYAWRHDGTAVPGFPIPLAGSGFLTPPPAVGDIDGDGTMEIVYAGFDGIYVFEHDGSLRAPWPEPVSAPHAAPVLADLDGDGRLEIVVSVAGGAFGSDGLRVWRDDRTPLPGFPIGIFNPGAPAVGDLDGDGAPELVVIENVAFEPEAYPAYPPDWVHAFHADGSPVAGWPVTLPGQTWWGLYDSSWKAPILADVDVDGDLDVVAPVSRRIGVWHGDGTLFPGTFPEDLWMQPVVTDLDGDGPLEIVYKQALMWGGPESNKLLAFHHDATPVAGWPVGYPDSTPGYSAADASLVTGDLDGDGDVEIVAAVMDRVLAWHGDGGAVDGFPLPAPSAVVIGFEGRPRSPALGDLDGDGGLDLVVPTQYGDVHLFGLGSPVSAGAPGWPMWQGNPAHTGVLAPTCGNGTVDPGEACDDGGDSAACDRNCTPAVCGDGTRNAAAGEACDGLDGADAGCCTAACLHTASGTSCDDGDVCTQRDACDQGACVGVVEPATQCRGQTRPGGSVAFVDAADDRRDKLTWTWTAGEATALADLGSPTTSSSYRLCVYDRSAAPAHLIVTKTIPAGGTCGTKPCWKALAGKGFLYKNRGAADPLDIQMLKLSAGEGGKAKIILRGQGERLDVAAPPFAPPLTVQLHNRQNGSCWGTDYSAVSANDPTRFVAKGE